MHPCIPLYGHKDDDNDDDGYDDDDDDNDDDDDDDKDDDDDDDDHEEEEDCWLLACLTFQQHASVSQGRIYSDNFMCCHIKIEVADPTFHLTRSQYTDTGPSTPNTAVPIFKSLV